MGALQYAGPPSSSGTDIATKRTVDTVIKGATTNQIAVEAAAEAAVASRVTKEYVDKQDSRYAPITEYKTKDDARNVLKTSVNTPDNPVSLPISASRFTNTLGSGYIMGPYGWQGLDTPTSSGSAVQIASLTTDAIPQGKRIWPVCFGQVLVTASDTGCLPVIEVRSGGGLMLANGRGRSMFTGGQGITAMPVGGTTWPESNGTPLTVTMWLSDLNGRSVTPKDGSTIAIGGSVYIMVAS
jgi:molybdopterin-binding protein